MSRPLRLALWAGGATAGALLAYAALVEPRTVRVSRPVVHVRGLPLGAEGLRIGLISDLHAGRVTVRRTLERAVDRLMAARPDLIAITGDFADRRPIDYESAFAVLRPLSAPLGVYCVPGNHDHAVGIEGWRRGMANAPNLIDATNHWHMRRRHGVRLCIAGADDLEEGSPDLRMPPPEDRDFTLLLAHNPDTAERARRRCDAVDLILSGHTHGGQVRLPFVGAVERKSEIYDAGLRRRPWTQVYTSRGVGSTFLPFRLGAPPEVTVLELTGRPRPVRNGAPA